MTTDAAATGRPSLPPLDTGDRLLDATAAAKEHRLSGRWADAEVSEFPKFTAWRLTIRLSRERLAGELGVTEALIRRIEEGQSPTLEFLRQLAVFARMTRGEALDLFSTDGQPPAL